MQPTPENYGAFQEAFDYFNRVLFAEQVPAVLFTMQRGTKFKGFFAPRRFRNVDGQVIHELALNPDYFRRPAREIASTLVHEMVHDWQDEHGKPGRNGYHNKEWATKMKAVGLLPTSTGKPGGKETGDKVTHVIMEGGAFDQAFDGLERQGFRFPWEPHQEIDVGVDGADVDQGGEGEAKPKPNKSLRIKYRCGCGEQAWGKPKLLLICGKCRGDFVATE
ncbi:MAG: SprT-like domain-containing protein [Planctomycetes bacterium]|nr:SprT-like domain-containing protein [Planctomycetota bacterium]